MDESNERGCAQARGVIAWVLLGKFPKIGSGFGSGNWNNKIWKVLQGVIW